MSKWPADWHPENAKEAQAFLDAHENGAGNPDLIEECERMVELEKRRGRSHPPTGSGGATKPSPFLQSPESR